MLMPCTWATSSGCKVAVVLEELALPCTLQLADVERHALLTAAFPMQPPHKEIPIIVDTEAADGPLAVHESGVNLICPAAERTGC